jgi:hypothetical protein
MSGPRFAKIRTHMMRLRTDFTSRRDGKPTVMRYIIRGQSTMAGYRDGEQYPRGDMLLVH